MQKTLKKNFNEYTKNVSFTKDDPLVQENKELKAEIEKRENGILKAKEDVIK